MWNTIKGFQNYEINELGEIRSKDRQIIDKCGRVQFFKGKPILPHLTENGYLFVALYQDGQKFQKKVHRLVAETFLPNPDNLPCINHKDQDKRNNSITNLEWCTIGYNNNYGDRNSRVSKKLLHREDLSKKILQINKNNEVINTYPSLIEASRMLLGNKTGASNISRVCRGIYKSAYGYKWKFVA